MRTEALEALLQEIWHLNPTLKDKISMTVSLATKALLQEMKRNELPAPLPQTLSQAPPEPAAVVAQEVPAAPVVDKPPPKPHPDSIWGP